MALGEPAAMRTRLQALGARCSAEIHGTCADLMQPYDPRITVSPLRKCEQQLVDTVSLELHVTSSGVESADTMTLDGKQPSKNKRYQVVPVYAVLCLLHVAPASLCATQVMQMMTMGWRIRAKTGGVYEQTICTGPH